MRRGSLCAPSSFWIQIPRTRVPVRSVLLIFGSLRWNQRKRRSRRLVESAAAVSAHRQGLRDDSRLRRVSVIWALLFFNALTPAQGSLLPIPHRIAQLMTQGALFMALVLAVTINPRMRMRPNWFLGLYTVLAISSLMMSVRLVGLGTEYRSFRLIGFLFVLWLLTPWWGRRDLLILRSQMGVILLILGLVVLGLFISPGRAMPAGRLSGTLWPIWSTGVAHYAGEVAGLTALLWLCRLVSHRRALLVAVPGSHRSRADPHAHGPHCHGRGPAALRVPACCSRGDGFAGFSRRFSSLLW